MARDAETAARAAFASGDLKLETFGDLPGVWANSPLGRFFVALEDLDVGGLARKRFTPGSDDPSDHVDAWAKGKNGKHVQIRIDTKGGGILNYQEIKDLLESDDDPEDPEQLKAIEKIVDEEETKTELWEWVLAEGLEGDVALLIDCASGDVLNWPQVGAAVRLDESWFEVGLKDTDVKEYRRSDGTVVHAYKQGRRDARFQLPGHRFVGHAQGEDQQPYEIHQNEVSGNQFAMMHAETGEHAPEGTRTGPWQGYKGANLLGLQQGKHNKRLGHPVAGPIRDLDATEGRKREAILAIAKSLGAMEKDVAKSLAKPGWPKDKTVALMVMMITRHLFRIGDGLGQTKGEETRGLSTLRAHEDVTSQPGQITFDFVGKAGKPWLRKEDDPFAVKLLTELIARAKPGQVLWTYDEKPGASVAKKGAKEKASKNIVTPEDVRTYLNQYGFNPHRFRNYAGSFEFYRFCRDWIDQNGTPADEKARKRLVVDATKAAAAILNDSPTAAKAYILSDMVDEVLNSGNIRDPMGFRPLSLEEDPGEGFRWWLPHETDFIAYVESMRGGVPELEEVWLYEPLQEGDRWVTLKPHGPESEDYARVIIRQHKDGTATVVGGSKHLLNLKLAKVGERRDIEKAEKMEKSRVLTPEDADREKAKREQRKKDLEGAQTKWAESVMKVIGYQGDPQELIKAYESGQAGRGQVSPEDRELERSRHMDRMKQITDGENPDAPKPGETKTSVGDGTGGDIQKAILESHLQDIIGEVPKELGGGASEELKKAFAEARSDPEKARQIAALNRVLENAKSTIKREQSTSGTSIRVMNRMAFFDEPEEADRRLLDQALNRATYEATSEFYRQVETAGLGIRDQHTNGAVEALTAISARFGGGNILDATMIRLVGPEAIAAAIAADIRGRGNTVLSVATDQVHKMIEEKHMPTITSAMQIAGELDEERKKIDAESAAGNLLTAAKAAARTQLTIGRQKALGFAAGSLQAAAAVADFLRRENPNGATIIPGDDRDRVVGLLTKVGMEEGTGFHLGRNGAGDMTIHIPEEQLPNLLKAARLNLQFDTERQAIKDHKANTDNFEERLTGMVKTIPITNDKGEQEEVAVKLKPGQQAAVLMMLKEAEKGPDNGILANLQTGLGKTLTFGAAADILFNEKGVTHGIYAMPAYLVDGTHEGLKKFFPGHDIVIAPSDRAKRQALYSGEHKNQIILVSIDTIRGDMDEKNGAPLRRMMESEKDRPGFLFGDEIHLAFTPNEKDDPNKQSARSTAVAEMRAPYMMAATGTPIRRSSAEVWKMLNYLRPGQFGSIQSWQGRFGKMGQGVSAFGDAMKDLFQRTIDPATITESEDAPVAHNKHTRFIDLSSEQWANYKGHDEKYYEAIKDPKLKTADRRKMVSDKTLAQRDAIFGGEASKNALIGHLQKDVGSHIERGERGIIHCTSIAAVNACVAAFKPGEMLKATGSDSRADRTKIIKALNTGAPIEGGRVALGSREGVLESVDGEKATVRGDDGKTFKCDLATLESKVAGVAGTSNSQGVLSAGLNLQGTQWNVHFQLPDSGATLKQRDARNLRTGQKKDVTSYYYVPETPTTRNHWRELQKQIALQAYVDDPTAYDDTGFMPNTREGLGATK